MKLIQQHPRQTYVMIKQKGSMLIIVFLALGVVLFTVLFVVSGSQTYFQNAQYNYNAEQATAIAEAGIDKALASLNATWGSYSGELETPLGDGSFSVLITNKDATTRILTVTGYIPNKTNPKVKRTILVQVAGTASDYSLIKGTYQVK